MADPEVRARHAAAMADPEVRARKSAAMKAAMADPEVRARHAAAMKAAMAAKRGFEIPGWVRAAGLEDDYVSIGEEFGEEYAAAHCRRLKRGMATASEAA